MAEKANLRECTEEELFLVKKENPPKAKVVPISMAVRVVPEPVQLLPVQEAKQPSWLKKNQTILIIAGAVLLVTAFIIWQKLEKEKRKKTDK
jgi:hypothetical protein